MEIFTHRFETSPPCLFSAFEIYFLSDSENCCIIFSFLTFQETYVTHIVCQRSLCIYKVNRSYKSVVSVYHLLHENERCHEPTRIYSPEINTTLFVPNGLPLGVPLQSFHNWHVFVRQPPIYDLGKVIGLLPLVKIYPEKFDVFR